MKPFSKIFRSIFKFLSSLKLAVIVILSLAYVLAVGTFYESLYSAAIAKQKVYGTIWFTLVLTFLGINVLCAALSRWPWKKHHLGFVITHAGIITILIGALITQQKGIEGTVALVEGETDTRLVLDEPLLQVAEPDLQAIQTWKIKFIKDFSADKPWIKKLKDGSELRIDQFFTHAQSVLEVKAGGGNENRALQVTLSGLPGGQKELSEWLFLKENSLLPSSIQLGPARLSFLDEEKLRSLKVESSPEKESKIGFLELNFDQDKTIKIQVEDAFQKKINIQQTPYSIQILRYLPDAVVRENQLVSRSDQPNNPALEFRITGPNVDETHLVFSRFPDLAGVHGKRKDALKVKAQFFSSDQASPLSKAELYLAIKTSPGPSFVRRGEAPPSPYEGEGVGERSHLHRNDKVKILYRIRSKGVLGKIQETIVGEKVATGWMTIQFEVSQFISDAVPSSRYRRVVLPAGKKDGPPPAMHLSIRNEGGIAETWIQQGDVKELAIRGVPYMIRYGLKTHPLGFSIQLKKFEVGRYPGTNSPSSFESFVEIKNIENKESFETKIHMNHPLKYNGFKLFQSSYQEGDNGEMTSVFSVARDPGIPIKYAGSILMISGIALMFWFKPLFVKKRTKA